jgi:CheY-like chemotaxis protein
MSLGTSARALHVLVVEDEMDAADSLARLVRLAGHYVQVAYSSQIGLLMAEKQTPDVVLLDIGLPKLNGYEVARRLRERPETKDALIVAVTGFGNESDREKAQEAGCDLHRLKPINAQELIRTINEHPKLSGSK